jgi:hypothetical protein
MFRKVNCIKIMPVRGWGDSRFLVLMLGPVDVVGPVFTDNCLSMNGLLDFNQFQHRSRQISRQLRPITPSQDGVLHSTSL